MPFQDDAYVGGCLAIGCVLFIVILVACTADDWKRGALDVAVCTAEKAAEEAREKGRHEIAHRLDVIAEDEAKLDDAGAGVR